MDDITRISPPIELKAKPSAFESAVTLLVHLVALIVLGCAPALVIAAWRWAL